MTRQAAERAGVSANGRWPARVLVGPSAGGVLCGTLLFALSLTPSMTPRAPVIQGLLGGALLALGYLLWQAAVGVAAWLGLAARTRAPVLLRRIALLVAGVLALVALAAGRGWQDSVRAAWGLPPLEGFASVWIATLALVAFLLLLVFGRLFGRLSDRLSSTASRALPTRAARAVGLLGATALAALLLDGVVLRGVLRMIDESSRLADDFVPPDTAPPSDPNRTGSAASLVAWEDLGRMGRDWVARTPSAEAIGTFWGGPARTPVRVYVGLIAAPTAEERARLAFEELRRVGGFERSHLVIAMPTGTGWLDPGAMDTLDYMTRGDVASVAVQYSYLPSPVSVLVDPTHGLEEARALFDLVYRHWTGLPREDRPRLTLHGLSLGAFLSQETVPLLDVLGDPFDGAMWAGSPFLSDFWRMVVDRRAPGSPAWRPRFGNGSLVRASNQEGALDRFDADWGPMRLVLLQYGSDPIVFFDWSLALRRPDWLGPDRAPDLSPQMRWFPFVTFAQVAVDMALALGVPGHGHDYQAQHYAPAWAAALGVEDWSSEDTERLAEHLDGASG
ncbi:alpha/beta hydrolase [Rubellimicrobium aerolatum]|uniref:Alpha/beta hydrolase n=1 Tax=Rubellimicrobium aerolatum TaxID=490979 RepID=A0ABW0SC12_9RHOB|nr:alpha/beta-hydrolase family protein [Rubellimicrobium aerolatum]MBP1806202.1 putative membrane protein [Rubellimicrobium aerolatum]